MMSRLRFMEYSDGLMSGWIDRGRGRFHEGAGGVVGDHAVAGQAEKLARRTLRCEVEEENRGDRDQELAESEDVLLLVELVVGRHVHIAVTALHAHQALP